MAILYTAKSPEAIKWVEGSLTHAAKRLIDTATIPHALLYLTQAAFPNHQSALRLYYAIDAHDNRRAYPITFPDGQSKTVSILSDSELAAFSSLYSLLSAEFPSTPSPLVFARKLDRETILENNPEQALLVAISFGANLLHHWN